MIHVGRVALGRMVPGIAAAAMLATAPAPAVSPVAKGEGTGAPTRLSGTVRGVTAAHAAAPVARVNARISPSRIPTRHGSVGTPIALHVGHAFSTSPPGATPFTVQRAEVLFPAGLKANGRLFPSCSARQIARFGNVISRCPKGSKIGSGSVTAIAIQLGVTAHGKVTLFNGNRGKSITFNVQTLHPAAINESFDAPLVRTHGAYAYRLAIDVPESLQQVLQGVWVGLRRFDVTARATVHAHGRTRGFVEALACPRTGRLRLHGAISFIDSTTGEKATTAVDPAIRCTRA